jgi:hypothetical protein
VANWKSVVTEPVERSSTEVLEMKTHLLNRFNNLARSLKPDDRVPYAFEKRIMAHLRSGKIADVWSVWSGTMWRAAFSCLLICVLTGAAVTFSEATTAELFASDLERTVLAPVDVDDSW